MIEYLDDCHTYLVDGVIVPSVTQLCTFATGKDFKGIPKGILNAKAEYGTTLHKAIEEYETQGTYPELKGYLKSGFDEYLRIRDEHISAPKCELIISYKDYFAGRLDILNGKDLIDIKTTYEVDVEWLQWQLGYYKLGLSEQGIYTRRHYCCWLPKGRAGKWVQVIPKEEGELIDNVFKYRRSHE